MTEGIEQLTRMFQDRDWFYDVGTDQYGRLVVYVKYMCHETLHDIPDKVAGKQVLCHFAASKLARADQFTNQGDNIPIPLVTPKALDITNEAELVDDIEELPSSFLEIDSSGLCKELDRLEKVCGTNILQDIFYEIHDGKNAVTNLSARYPEVRASLDKLYDEYGFDVIYEELDGWVYLNQQMNKS